MPYNCRGVPREEWGTPKTDKRFIAVTTAMSQGFGMPQRNEGLWGAPLGAGCP